MPLIVGLAAHMTAAALAKAGGRWTPVYRQPADANGVPAGEPVRIGCMLGMPVCQGTDERHHHRHAGYDRAARHAAL